MSDFVTRDGSGTAQESNWTLYTRAPVVPEAIADDLIYAFAHGWILLPLTTHSGEEASERLTRLHAVRKFAEKEWRRV